MKTQDYSIENLLELHGERIVIDESLGLWVKFEVLRTASRSQGIKYSLTLHDKTNKRILGFDNSHEIQHKGKRGVSPIRVFDHWHYDEKDKGRPYYYVNAGQLIEDFWKEVDKRIETLKEVGYE